MAELFRLRFGLSDDWRAPDLLVVWTLLAVDLLIGLACFSQNYEL